MEAPKRLIVPWVALRDFPLWVALLEFPERLQHFPDLLRSLRGRLEAWKFQCRAAAFVAIYIGHKDISDSWRENTQHSADGNYACEVCSSTSRISEKNARGSCYRVRFE